MAVNVDDKIKKLSPAQRKKVEVRAAELIAEEMTLCELRHARKLTQVRMAKKLGITQDSVSRLEKRSDLLLSTLRKTVGALKSKSHDRAPRENHQRVRECFDAPPLAEAGRPALGIAGLPGQDLLGERAHTSRGLAGPDGTEYGPSVIEAPLRDNEPGRVGISTALTGW